MKRSALRCLFLLTPRAGMITALGLVAFPSVRAVPEPPPVRERISFNSGWRFQHGDPADGVGKLSYTNIQSWVAATGAEFTTNAPSLRPGGKLGADVAYTQAAYNDSAWRLLNLPHDWGIEGPFNQELPGESGKLPWWGVAWYRKHFTLPETDGARRVYLDVDGAMSFANVWLNGQYVGGWPHGYASWRLDLTPHLKFGGENTLAIRIDNPPDSSRWYPGGGIYRNVWLVKTSPVHVGQWGTFVTTPEVAAASATVKLRTEVRNASDSKALISLKHEIFEMDAGDVKGRAVMLVTGGSLQVGGGRLEAATSRFTLRNPRLWSVEKPQRYLAVTSLEQNGRLLDRYETPFGIRSIRFTATNGFLLNEVRVPLRGVCNHHDLGALGAALNPRALERQLEILREMGCNAIRTSHNPPAPELLDLCDRLGFLVLDEFSDTWRSAKKPNGYARLFEDWAEKDLRAFIRRDRNHPSVIAWSTGNEIKEQGSPAGHQISAALTAVVHEEDPTRPATAACNQVAAGYNGFQKTVDVFGYNYKPEEYGKFRAANPDLPLYGSETASCVSSRGEYFFPVTNDPAAGRSDYQVSSYDLCAPPWGTPPDHEFQGQDEFPFVAGEFVWTGFDYLGEPTPYNSALSNLLNYTDPAARERAEKELKEIGKIRVPSRSSYFGILDLAGFKKDRFYLYQARWRPELPMAHILPHWNWPGREGQITPVHVYTSGDEAELFLNDRSLGRKKRGQFSYRLRWDDVVYQPGELRVVAYKAGKKWAGDVMETAGPARELTLESDRSRLTADGRDLAFLTVSVTDKSGRPVPRARHRIRFEIEGPGEIVATDNGNATDFESFQSPERNAYNGLALAIVRTLAGQDGTIKVTAVADGFESESVRLRSRMAD